ncbi:uncharacterized protein LOC129773473 [Toxorhynchites rutilus septentrionalis]|uniref:uncharacterized protein LOC129773473 n=1 Tax=Toxorhynchites rutilus septentrionalis TaxID=329112 RepID=UPI002478F80C|nr:uncharacterized protein LOC129773473 [Toxorhynchites rutilus septentrionalis]
MSDSSFQRLESPKFAIGSPRARNTKHLQQELIRASDRKNRSSKKVLNRFLLSDPYEGQRRVREAHKHISQYDQRLQNAVDLYITSELAKRQIPALQIKNHEQLVQNIVNQFFEQDPIIQRKFIRASLLSQPKQTVVCSDPFLIFLNLHRKQSNIDRELSRVRSGENIDIGTFSHNIERAEAGEEVDPTRLRLISWDRFVADAKATWKRMNPDQKMPFFVQAFLAIQFPEKLDQAL